MQTWLPYSDYRASARCLADVQLFQQQTDCVEIFNSMIRTQGLVKHPVFRMWSPYPKEFVRYWAAVTNECARRGFGVRMFPPFAGVMKLKECKPSWLGREKLHSSHRSGLLGKNPRWYGKIGWEVTPNLPMVWPEG